MADSYSAAVNDALPPDDNMRVGIVTQAAPLIVNVQGGEVRTPGVLAGANFAVNDTVSLLRQNQSWLVLGTVSSSNTTSVSGASGVNGYTGNDTTSSAGFSTLGTSTAPFVKRLAGTKVKIEFAASCYSTVASTAVEYAVRITGPVTLTAVTSGLFINNINEHLFAAGTALLTGAPAGSYVADPLWRRVSGTGVLTTDAGDWISYVLTEVD